ncbi:MAG: hypothetical protein K5829_07255 [Treponema sp.]|nr:hypothetical protein [Treponema sp.]
MKKRVVVIFIALFLTTVLSAQTNNSVDITDDVYEILSTAQLRGLCGSLSNVKPYTESYILEKLSEIENTLASKDDNVSKKELEVIAEQKKKFIHEEGLKFINLNYRTKGEKDSVPVTLDVDLSTNGFFSGGIYSNSGNNSFGYETYETLDIKGDLGKNISYRAMGYVGATEMPMTKLGTYDIGYWWYDFENINSEEEKAKAAVRYIDTYRNYSVLPYSYKKFWDGSVYYIDGGLNAAGLTGWAFQDAIGLGMQGEIRASFHNNLIEFSLGRVNREWAAMDNNSSLVLNSNAHPFFAVEASAHPFEWISFSTLTGFLEFPNRDYMVSNAWYLTGGNGNDEEALAETKTSVHDSYFYHNLFSIGMLDVDLKYLHWDFGSAVVYPNRFELGYAFPLIDRVVYQNNVGDYDNLSLFTNLKVKYPGLGFVWGSFYLDEMNSLSAKIFTATRCMFAYQAGTKILFPWLSFGSFSFRYTKVEPYCYTHQALSSSQSQPYYPDYLAESYTNNGESIGYYLPPNADEFFVRFDTKPFAASSFALQYQLIRHGVDWGADANMYSGSSIYSELPTGSLRGQLSKYFLKDGTYEWMNIVSLSGSYDLKRHGIPLFLYATVGYVNNWFTSIGSQTPSKNAKYEKYNTDEYKDTQGVVISVGFKAFKY